MGIRHRLGPTLVPRRQLVVLLLVVVIALCRLRRSQQEVVGLLRLAVARSPVLTAGLALTLARPGSPAKAEDVQYFDLFSSRLVAVVDFGGDLITRK